MAVPDLTPYIDLRFYDLDPQDIYDLAVLDLQTRLPEWQPREGNIEVMLLEAMALQVAEAIFAANRLPAAIVMALMRLYGVDPDFGSPPTVNLTFQLSDATGHDIPEGTNVRLDLPGGLEPVVFTTTVALSIPTGSTSGTVLGTGDRYTDEANGTPAGTRVEIIDSLLYVESVTLFDAVIGGVEPESDDDWIERGVQRFGRLSETLVLPRHFEEAALEVAGIVRVKAIDNWNGVSSTPGSDGGYVTVAVYGEGAPVPAATKTALDATLEAEALANLNVVVIDPTVTAVAVTVQVRRTPGYDDPTVQANVRAALTAWMNTDTWDWSGTVRRNELISVITNAEGVDYVDTLTTPAADVVLTGQATLATIGTMTVTTIA